MARKTQRRPDKIELGVVDIHTHVLPGIDDGAEKMALSYRMLRRSYKQGVRKVIATPHYATYHWRTKPQQIQELMEKLAARVRKAMPDLELYRGQEIQYFEGMVEMLREGKLLTLAGSRYVLTEFLPTSSWSQIERAVRELTMAGYLPVLAHIERYQCLREKGRLEELMKEGAYLQMNYGSLTKLSHFWKIREAVSLPDSCRSKIRKRSYWMRNCKRIDVCEKMQMFFEITWLQNIDKFRYRACMREP